MERMMTGDGRVRTFAECRNRRNRRTLLRVSVVLGVLLAAILALLFCLGRFAGRGPFAPGAAQAKYSPSSWSLIVVNRWNRIPDDYPAPKLTRLSNGESVDSRIYPDLQRMFDDMRAAGLHPEVTSAYRTEAVQRQLLDEKIFLYQNEGASKEEARRQASQWVAEPGTSEHELGLAVDISTDTGMSFEAIVSITASPDMIGRSRSSSTMSMDCSASMRTASSPLYATRVAYPSNRSASSSAAARSRSSSTISMRMGTSSDT